MPRHYRTSNSPTSTVSARSFRRIVTVWSFCLDVLQWVVRRSIRVVAPVTSCWRLHRLRNPWTQTRHPVASRERGHCRSPAPRLTPSSARRMGHDASVILAVIGRPHFFLIEERSDPQSERSPTPHRVRSRTSQHSQLFRSPLERVRHNYETQSVAALRSRSCP